MTMPAQEQTDRSEPLSASRLFAPADRTLPTMLRRQAERHGAKPLVRIGDRAWTYADAPRLAARAAARLVQAGVGAGDRVALLCTNSPEFIEMLLGCGWLGAVLVPINTALRGAQLQHILANSGARLLVVEAGLAGALETIDLATLPLDALWLIDEPTGNLAPPTLAHPMPALGSAEIDPSPLRPGDLLAILYTSGTTGPSGPRTRPCSPSPGPGR